MTAAYAKPTITIAEWQTKGEDQWRSAGSRSCILTVFGPKATVDLEIDGGVDNSADMSMQPEEVDEFIQRLQAAKAIALSCREGWKTGKA